MAKTTAHGNRRIAWWMTFLIVILAATANSAEKDLPVELVTLKTADGIVLNGVLRQPGPCYSHAGVIMVHGYSGNFYSGIMSFLPEELTKRDFATLALNMRDHDRDPKSNRFEDNHLDIAAGVDEMARRGFTPLFLYGHSMGTNRVLSYLANASDPRVQGVVLTGPPGNLFEWNVRMFGKEKATQVLEEAQGLVAEGKGDEWMLMDLGPLGKAIYSATHVVSLRGPETLSDPFKNIARISIPILIVHGSEDKLADPAVAEQLSRSAGRHAKVEVLPIAGAGHGFEEHEEVLASAIASWLVKLSP